LLCMDAGLRGCGVAQFQSGRLARAEYIPNTARTERGAGAHSEMAVEVLKWVAHFYAGGGFWVVEFPRIYPVEKQVGDQNDLLEVAGVASAVTSAIRTKWPTTKLKSVLPRDWKGTVKKEVMTERILSKLAESETAVIVCREPSLRHNVIDGVGIGLAQLGRLNERRFW